MALGDKGAHYMARCEAKKRLKGTLILLRQYKSCANFQQKHLSQTTNCRQAVLNKQMIIRKKQSDQLSLQLGPDGWSVTVSS